MTATNSKEIVSVKVERLPDYDPDLSLVEQDYERMESYNRGDWGMIGIRATAEIVVNGTYQTVASGGLWGIESDSGEAYFAEVGREELSQLADVLDGLGFSEDEIAEAMEGVDESGE